MAFKLIARNLCTVPVKGFLKEESGKPERFEFTLICRRTGAGDLRKKLDEAGRNTIDFMTEVVESWKGVNDEVGNPVVFSEEALATLLDTPGLANMAFDAYLVEQGAREKN